MATQSIDPRDVGRLRVCYRTKREFLAEHNVIGDNEYPARERLTQLIGQLVYGERQALEARLNDRLTRLNELMEGERKTFDEPAAEPTDLVAEVRLSRDDIRQ